MRFDRAAAGLAFVAIIEALAFAPDVPKGATYVLLGLAALVAIVTFAPILPLLNRARRIGASKVVPYISSEAIDGVPNHVVMRVGFENKGPRRVDGVIVNVLVPSQLVIRASDHNGQYIARGSDMPETILDGEPTRFWAEKDQSISVGSLLLHYRLEAPEPGGYKVRVTFGSDDLYGQADRVLDGTVAIGDARPA